MPGFDRTGPAGMGPMTGGGRGWCNPDGTLYHPGFPVPARPYYARPFGRPRWGLGQAFWGRGIGLGRGRGQGLGRGRGRRW
jgi:hypothetical protein